MSATALQLWLEELPEDFWWTTLGTFVVHELAFLVFNGICAHTLAANRSARSPDPPFADMVIDEYNLFQRYKLQKVRRDSSRLFANSCLCFRSAPPTLVCA